MEEITGCFSIIRMALSAKCAEMVQDASADTGMKKDWQAMYNVWKRPPDWSSEKESMSGIILFSLILLPEMKLDMEADADGEKVPCHYLELGTPGLPHAVVVLDEHADMTEEGLRSLGRKLRSSKDFRKGANVNFCRVVGKEEVEELTFERGVEDFTLACGTGTGSVVAALAMKGLVEGKHTKVHVPGGQLIISLERAADGQIEKIFLTGPTNIVAEGMVLDEDCRALI